MNDMRSLQWSQPVAKPWAAVVPGIPSRQRESYAEWKQERRRARQLDYANLQWSASGRTECRPTTPALTIVDEAIETKKQQVINFVETALQPAFKPDRHEEKQADDSIVLEWILPRRRLLLQIFSDLTMQWLVANLAADPWRESAGVVQDTSDLSAAVTDLLA